MKAPSHLTALQIRNILKGVVTNLSHLHPQRIKREMLKLGAERWHGVLMLESTAATQFIESHLVSEDIPASDAQNPTATQPRG